MQTSDEVAEQVLAAVRTLFEALRKQMGNVPEDVLAEARISLHMMTKELPRPSRAALEAAREAGANIPQAPPETWVGFTAGTMVVALLEDKRRG